MAAAEKNEPKKNRQRAELSQVPNLLKAGEKVANQANIGNLVILHDSTGICLGGIG